MNEVTAALLGLLAGLVLAGLAWSVHVSRHHRDEIDDPDGGLAGPVVPRGVRDVLGVLRSGGIVVDRTGQVLLASAPAAGSGLVRGRELEHEELRALVSTVQRDGVIREREFEIRRGPIGSGRVVLSARVAPLRDDLVVVIVEDRTQARRVEEVRRDFVVNVSHELKTPVGGLSLLAEAVQDAADDPEAVARFAGRMRSETSRLSRLVGEIVDLSRLQTSDLLADMVVVDVAACAEEAVDETRLLAGHRDVVAMAVHDRSRLRVYGDHKLITTAIRNLVSNAISYSEDSTRVSVVTRRSGDLVEVAVSDQGRGISVADQERIFERFYRVDAARSRSTGGTGLGLSIVKHVTANHGGDVRVWSHEGQGSTFTLRFPAAGDDSLPVGAPAPAQAGYPARVADPAHGDDIPSGASTGPLPRTRKGETR